MDEVEEGAIVRILQYVCNADSESDSSHLSVFRKLLTPLCSNSTSKSSGLPPLSHDFCGNKYGDSGLWNLTQVPICFHRTGGGEQDKTKGATQGSNREPWCSGIGSWPGQWDSTPSQEGECWPLQDPGCKGCREVCWTHASIHRVQNPVFPCLSVPKQRLCPPSSMKRQEIPDVFYKHQINS